jgi:hypothetical protein
MKRTYITPEILDIKIDLAISLQYQTVPPTPGGSGYGDPNDIYSVRQQDGVYGNDGIWQQ